MQYPKVYEDSDQQYVVLLRLYVGIAKQYLYG